MFEEVKIFNKSNEIDYKNFLTKNGLILDVYYSPEFLNIDAQIQNGEYEIFTLVKNRNIFVYPYIKLKFDKPELKDYFDLTSPYGYCGPYCSNDIFFKEAESLFIKYISEKCVTEFIRYHFIYNENVKFSQNIKNIQNRTIVVLNSKQSWEDIWTKEFSSGNRNLIRKLEKEGYTFEETNRLADLEAFIDMYYLTMNNSGANSFYYFKKQIILDLYENLGDKIILVKVEKENIVYSYSLFFLSGEIGTYYLSARNLDFGKIPATNYLLSKTIELLKSKNINVINFGGGLTNDLNDHLYKFKSNFSKQNKDFFIGKRIFNDKIYKEIVEDWISNYGSDDYESRKQILQFYR